LVFSWNFFLEQLGGHQHRREGIVQVVRDAAGQRADAFQPLGAQKLRLVFLFSASSSRIFSRRDGPPTQDVPAGA
jgi:hypothetical protein